MSLRTINRIQSGMLVKKCISGEKSDIVLSNHNYGGRQISKQNGIMKSLGTLIGE